MPAKKSSAKKAPSAQSSTDEIHQELKKALADARSKLKKAKGGKNLDTKTKLIDHCTGIIDDIWFC